MRRRKVLFRFRHGLGDAVQFTVVLRHLIDQRPDWEVDVAALWGKHSVFHGLCRRSYDDREGWPDGSKYDEVHDTPWHESNVTRSDVPSTKACRYVLELGLQPRAELFRYWMADNAVASARVHQWLDSESVAQLPDGRYNAVVVHHQGNTAMSEKNIDPVPALAIGLAAQHAGMRVILLDWDNRSMLSRLPGVLVAPTGDQDIWGEAGTGDAAGIRELIQACRMMVGVDSGPLHVAGTTTTGTAALWVAHHPARYYDLAPNVVHHVPGELLDDRTEFAEALRSLYRTRRCRHQWGEQGIGELIGDMLGQEGELLHIAGHRVRRSHAAADFEAAYISPTNVTALRRVTRYTPGTIQVAVPPGIGDGAWCALVLESLLSRYYADKVAISVCYGEPYRAHDYWTRFPFVESCRRTEWWCHRPVQRLDGISDYDNTGEGFHDEFDWLLLPNKELDRGQRIETCFPNLDINWAVHDTWRFHEQERLNAETLSQEIGPYVVFYASSLQNNTTHGHNRNELWKPSDWVSLARMLQDLGLAVVVVGESYDASYYSDKLVPAGIENLGNVVNKIGMTTIGETFALCQKSAGVVSFQSGIGIVALYMNCNVAMWWRPYGDSLVPDHYLSLHEGMATAWTPPGVVESGQYLPLIYTRCSPEQIANHVRDRWLRPNGHAVTLDRSVDRGDNLRTFGSVLEQTARG